MEVWDVMGKSSATEIEAVSAIYGSADMEMKRVLGVAASVVSEQSQVSVETAPNKPIHLYSPKYAEGEAEHRQFDSFIHSMCSTAVVPLSSFYLHYQTDLPTCDSLEKFLILFGHSIRVLRLDLRGRATAEDFSTLRRALSPLKQVQELSLACWWRWRRMSPDPTHILPPEECSAVGISEMPSLCQFEFEGAAKSVAAYHGPLLGDILRATPALKTLNMRNPRQSELQLLQDLCKSPLQLTKLQFTFSDDMEAWSHLSDFLCTQSPTLSSLHITVSDKDSKIKGRLRFPRLENLVELSLHFYAQNMCNYLGVENGEVMDNLSRLEQFEYHGPMDAHNSKGRPSHVLELLAHDGVRQLNLKLDKSDSTKETLNMLPVLFPSVTKLKIALQTHSLDVVSCLWILWPGLRSLAVDGIYAPDAQAHWNSSDKPPQGNLDELLTGVPFSKHEILAKEIAKIAGSPPEDIGSLPININLDHVRHCLQKYKIKPGVVDACCLEEIKIEPRGVGNSSWYHSSVTHLGVLALAMAGARLKSVRLITTGLGGCRSGVYVSEDALRILRSASGPAAIIEIC